MTDPAGRLKAFAYVNADRAPKVFALQTVHSLVSLSRPLAR